MVVGQHTFHGFAKVLNIYLFRDILTKCLLESNYDSYRYLMGQLVHPTTAVLWFRGQGGGLETLPGSGTVLASRFQGQLG